MILSVPPRLAVQSGKGGLVRLLDRDDLSGQGGPAHTGGELQLLNLPAGRRSPDAAVTAVSPAAAGSLQVGPGDVGLSVSVLPFGAGRTRALGTLLHVAGVPAGSVQMTNLSSAPLNVVLDISGYFR